MADWLPADRDPATVAASVARACAPPARGFLDTSMLPSPGPGADAAHRGRATAYAAALAALPIPGGPIVLPDVYGEAVGVLRWLRGEGAVAALLERWRIATAGARKLDAAAVAAGVRVLRALDAVAGLSKSPSTKGRQTDRKLVAAAFWTACAGGRPATIVTRDGDIARLVAATKACAEGAAASALRARPVTVWMFNHAAGVFAPAALAASAGAEAGAGAAAEAVRDWLSAIVR